jgi:hypothetical protein
MTEQKHTPEPWTTDAACGFPRDVHDAEGMLIAHCSSEFAARRVVAAVNACTGLDTEYLETVGLPEFAGKQLCADMVQQELDAIIAERDMLRSVCAEAYQFAGAYDAPVEVLDNLSAAANGLPLPHESFLPVADSDAVVRRDQLRAALQGVVDAHFDGAGEVDLRLSIKDARAALAATEDV